jgi:hypothetical protein
MSGDVAIAFMPERGGYGTTDRAGTPSSALEAEGQRRGKDPAETSGGFVYRKGKYARLGVVPGAVPLSTPDFPDATTLSTHYAINNHGETAGNYADTIGEDGLAPPGSTHGFVRDRRGGSTPTAASRRTRSTASSGTTVRSPDSTSPVRWRPMPIA